MPLINLIHEQRLAQRKAAARIRILLVGLGVCGSASLFGFLYLFMKTNTLETEGTGLTAKLEKLRPVVEQIESDKKLLATMKPKLETLESAREETDRWERVLEHLTQQTPKGIWLTNLRTQPTDPKSPVSISFTGKGTTQDVIGSYILRLQNCPDLGSVALKFTQEKAMDNGPDLEFEIGGQVLGTAEEKERTKTVGEGDETEVKPA